MIRRSVTVRDGSQQWSLVSQIEHARLSGQLAEAWGNDRVAPVIAAGEPAEGDVASVRREVLAAITHHDDGWAEWEKSPTMDQHGRPYSFTEMPSEESLQIWRSSILACESIGYLAAWMVAGHFVELLRGSDSADAPRAIQWLAEMESRRQEWFAGWSEHYPRLHTKSLAQLALDWLRSFDALSLWFCCGRSEQFSFPPLSSSVLPLEEPVTFVPADASPENKVIDVGISPWPFSSPQLTLSASALLVPAGSYDNPQELFRSAHVHERRWRLTSGEQNVVSARQP